MERVLEFSEHDLLRGARAVEAGLETGRLGSAECPEFEKLVFASLVLAAAELSEGAGASPAAFQGAGAFVVGYLLAVSLVPDADPCLGDEWLAPAIEEIRERGRHAVIADSCDLSGVANLERGYAVEWVRRVPLALSDEDELRLRDAFGGLFESGLALGLLRVGRQIRA